MIQLDTANTMKGRGCAKRNMSLAHVHDLSTHWPCVLSWFSPNLKLPPTILTYNNVSVSSLGSSISVGSSDDSSDPDSYNCSGSSPESSESSVGSSDSSSCDSSSSSSERPEPSVGSSNTLSSDSSGSSSENSEPSVGSSHSLSSNSSGSSESSVSSVGSSDWVSSNS